MAQVISSVRESLADVPEKARDVASDLADRVEEALDSAGAQGRRISKKMKKELARRWAVVDRTGRENAFVMALGALGVGILVGYLLSRDRD